MRLARRFLAASVVMSALIAGSACDARAANFSVIDLPNDGGKGVLLTGPIQPGDQVAFRQVAATLSDATMVTTGPGGAVSAALAIGTEVYNRGWPTLVPANGMCASACSMIWLAGHRRMLGKNAQIGFHAMSMIQQGHWGETHEADNYFRNWLTQLGYAWDTTATIVNTHATSVRWYDMIELNANGIETHNYP
jgi:hypothetical protein